MSVPLAYILVIIIWSTTPLAIKWSSAGVGYEFGVAARMLIGLLALMVIVKLANITLPWNKHARMVYLASGLPILIAMSIVYWSAQFIPSGWISVIFGLSPIFTSVFASYLLAENSFSGGRVLGMLLGLAGLLVVFAEGLTVSPHAWAGVLGVTMTALTQSLGAVFIKRLKPAMHPIAITTGGMMFAIPFFVLNCMLAGGIPDTIPRQTMLSIIYLAVLGTTIGFPTYFYLLKNINAERVALITLITPVTALYLGALLNDEAISTRVLLGTALILGGLAIYEYGKYLPFRKKWQKRWKQTPL